ncbi:MAG: hypothetical protein J6Y78_11255 [Paludibacteraceae bacterium]|nr:hypothetical protein [Paludibacteraceae bacterium]
MSEKRFTLTDWHEVKEDGKIMTVDEVIKTLNDLYEENENLKKERILLDYQLKVQDRIINEYERG